MLVTYIGLSGFDNYMSVSNSETVIWKKFIDDQGED